MPRRTKLMMTKPMMKIIVIPNDNENNMIPGKINEEKEKQRRIHCPKPKTRKWEEKMVEECGS